MPRKKIRAARVKKKHRDASSSGASSSEEEGAGRASASASPKKDRKKLSFKEREALRHTSLTVSHEWISDFRGAPEEDIAPLGMPHLFDAVQPHPVTGDECLYIPLNPEGLWDKRRGYHWASNEEVWGRIPP